MSSYLHIPWTMNGTTSPGEAPQTGAGRLESMTPASSRITNQEQTGRYSIAVSELLSAYWRTPSAYLGLRPDVGL